MGLAADDEPEPTGSAAEIVSPVSFEMLPSPRIPGTRVNGRVAADGHPATQAKFCAAHDEIAHMAISNSPRRRTPILLERGRPHAGAHKGKEARRTPATVSPAETSNGVRVAVSGMPNGNPPLEEERALARLLEAEAVDVDEEAAPERQLQPAAVQRVNGLAEDGSNVSVRREFLACKDEERVEAKGPARRSASPSRREDETERRPIDGDSRRDQEHSRRTRRVSLRQPQSEQRAAGIDLAEPEESLSRPAAPRSVAKRSRAASIAAGDVMPCCISIAATPETWGVADDVPVK